MKSSNLALIITLSIVLLGGGAYVYSQKTSQPTTNSMEEPIAMPVETTQSPEGEPAETTDSANSQYVEYTQSAIDAAANGRRVLFFYASWCPTCIPADADFKTNTDQFPSDLTVIRVNYNDPQTDEDEEALAEKYGITYQHTFVQIDEQGNEVTKWNGGQTEELLKNIK